MEDKYIEESVKEVIEDLKSKVDALTEAASGSDETVAEKVEAVKNKAVKVFQDVTERLKGLSESAANEEELAKAISTIKDKSKDLYENALNKIDELRGGKKEGSESEKDATPAEQKEDADPFTEVKKGIENIVADAKAEFDDFMHREDVKEAVDKAKVQAVDIAEKTLEILKGWLTPDGDDK